jgi:hypothetical protein
MWAVHCFSHVSHRLLVGRKRLAATMPSRRLQGCVIASRRVTTNCANLNNESTAAMMQLLAMMCLFSRAPHLHSSMPCIKEGAESLM